MLVKELRNTIDNYSNAELKDIIIELYKAIPKKAKEDKYIDKMIEDITKFKNSRKLNKTSQKLTEIDMDDLKTDIEQFIDYAYKQYFFAPNQYVHKRDRPKWRFTAKKFIKALEIAAVKEENRKTVLELLTKIYEMLSYGCAYTIFSSDDPFRSVMIEQTKLFDKVISLYFSMELTADSIRFALELMMNSYLDRETLHSSLMKEILKHLKTSDSKEIAAEQCSLLIKRVKNQSSTSKRSDSDYYKRNKINNLAEMGLRCYISLCEYEKGTEFFKTHSTESNKEISLYVLLRLLYEYDLKKYWLTEYKNALSNGITPRKSLKANYDYLKENDSFNYYY